MTHRAQLLPITAFLAENEAAFIGVKVINVSLFIDEGIYDEVIELLQDRKHKTRFIRILIHVLQNQYNDELYRKEGYNEKTRNVTAMKFKGRGTNTRIYCKEYFPGVTGAGKKIVMAHLLQHKSAQKNDKKIKARIDAIADYEYEFGEI